MAIREFAWGEGWSKLFSSNFFQSSPLKNLLHQLFAVLAVRFKREFSFSGGTKQAYLPGIAVQEIYRDVKEENSNSHYWPLNLKFLEKMDKEFLVTEPHNNTNKLLKLSEMYPNYYKVTEE
ncbi:hypothetical protein LguiA_027955 [Lonicera macranthoides]